MYGELFQEERVIPSDTPTPKLVSLKVCHAMMQMTWDDLHRVKFRERKDRLDSMEWVMHDDDRIPEGFVPGKGKRRSNTDLSFNNACRVLGHDPDAIRGAFYRAGLLNIGMLRYRIETCETEDEWNATETVKPLRAGGGRLMRHISDSKRQRINMR